MQYSVAHTGDNHLVEMSGRFTFTDYQTFRGLLDLMKQKSGGRIVMALKGVEFVDSAALGMLLIAHEEAQAAGKTLVLREPQGQVRKTLQMASFDSMFAIEH